MIPFTVNETILASTDFSPFYLGYDDLSSDNFVDLPAAQRLLDRYHNGLFTNLSNFDCINAYGGKFQSSWSDVLLVTKEPLNHSHFPFQSPGTLITTNFCGTYLPSLWVCGQFETPNVDCRTEQCHSSPEATRELAADWRPFGVKIEHCLAMKSTENCKLQVNMPLCVVVVVLNLMKLAAMLMVCHVVRETPLLTVGDAIASFLRDQDETTAGMCLKSKREFTMGEKSWIPLSEQFRDRRSFRFTAVGIARWLSLAVL